MDTISILYDRFTSSQRELFNCVTTIKDKVLEISQSNNFEYFMETLPEPDEHLISVIINENTVFTKWEYIEQYDDLNSTETSWLIPIEWFSMDACDLTSELQTRNDLSHNRKFKQLSREAEYLGCILSKKHDDRK